MKTIPALLISGLVASAAWAQVQAPAGARVAVISTMEKLRPDQQPEGATDRVSLFAARGEAESSQVLVLAPADRALSGVTVTAAPLKTESGATLDLTLSQIGYVNIPLPTPDGYDTVGDYPDILYPLKPFDVAAGGNQAIWVTAWVPVDATPGVYSGALTLKDDRGLLASVPVSVKVFSTALPRQAFLKTAFGYGPWNHERPAYYGKGWTGSAAEEAFLKRMIDYRMTPVNSDIGGMLRTLKDTFSKDASGRWQADWEAFDKEVAQRLDEGWTCFQVAHIPLGWRRPDAKRNLTEAVNRWGSPSQDDQTQILRLLNDHLVTKGWADRFVFKCFDEPSINDHNAAWLREFMAFFQDNAPDLRLFMITTDCREIKLAGEDPVYTWVPHLPSLYGHAPYEAFLAERQKAGEEAWTYICDTRTMHPISHKFPDVAPIDRTGTSQRCFGVLAWRSRLDGFLYWNVSEWDGYGGYDSPGKKNKGEGVLFYPDLKEHGTPFPSVRAEVLRDGFEDYDLLYLLNRRIAELESQSTPDAATKQRLAEARELLDVSELIPNFRDFNRDPAAYEEHHRRVLEMLESLTPAPTAMQGTANL